MLVALSGLMRAKKCLVVGDPLQLEPVVTIPKSTCELLRKKAEALIEFDLYATSLQSLCDQSENIGTFIEKNDDEKLWIGSPLRAHNRCLNPMFEISNKTTYNGLMIFAKHGKKLEDRTGSYHPSLGDVGIVTPPSFFNSKPLCSF